MCKIASMVKQMVTGHNPQADAQKTVSESFQKEAQDVRNGAPSLFYQGGKFDWQFKRKSGWQMARLV